MCFKKTFFAASIIAMTSSVHAAPTIYTDRSDFLDAVYSASESVINFESFENASDFTSNSFNNGSIEITSPSSIYQEDYSSHISHGTYSLGTTISNSSMGFNFNSMVNAFGFDLHDYGTCCTASGETWDFSTSSGDVISFGSSEIDYGTSFNGFIGFITDVGFDSISAIKSSGSSGDIIAMDRMFYGSVSAVPEPSTYALMAGGLGLVGFMAARRRKQA